MEKLQQEAEQLSTYIKKCGDHHDPTHMIQIYLESAFLDGKIAGLWERKRTERTEREESIRIN